MGAGVAAATDLTSGVSDRFRSLPVTRLAVISAQVLGRLLEQVIGVVVIVGMGLLFGWRPQVGVGGALELAGLVLLGLFSFTWLGVLLGLVLRSADAVQGVGFALVLPLTFLAGTFVPIEGMQTVPRVIGEWDPLSALVAALRQVSQGTTAHGSWQLEHPIVAMVGWCVAITAVCVPLALRRFRRSALG
jgi:ABC-type multidrug transport system permease subunit